MSHPTATPVLPPVEGLKEHDQLVLLREAGLSLGKVLEDSMEGRFCCWKMTVPPMPLKCVYMLKL